MKDTLSSYWLHIQEELLPWLNDTACGPLNEHHTQLVCVLGMARIEALLPAWHGLPERPLSERAALARAFAEFAASTLPSRLHEALIQETHKDRLVGHISRDSTAIEAREKPVKPDQPVSAEQPKHKRGRPRKGEVRQPSRPSRIEQQLDMAKAGASAGAMLAGLARHCDVGAKRNAKRHQDSWIGYKLHIDTADGGIPISCMLTAASVHDSQVVIPLATITATRVSSCYDLMDSSYDAEAIKQHSRHLGHVPIIDINPRATPRLKQELADEAKRQRRIGHRMAEDVRYGERSTAERINGGLKDSHGGRSVRARGADKVMCHPMFGVLSFTVLQLVRLVI